MLLNALPLLVLPPLLSKLGVCAAPLTLAAAARCCC